MRFLDGLAAEPESSKVGLFNVPQNPHFIDASPFGMAKSAPQDSQFTFINLPDILSPLSL